MVYKFEEISNDLMDYFILGDPELLLQFKNSRNLPDDLITEFTTQPTIDEAVEQGVLIPMCGVENHPYNIYFNFDDSSIFSKQENQLQHRQDGYCLHITNEIVCFYTMPSLRTFTAEQIQRLKDNRLTSWDVLLMKKCPTPSIALQNGWYSVSVLAGLVLDEGYYEPAFEFLINPSEKKPNYTANYSYRFSVNSSLGLSQKLMPFPNN